MTKKKEVKKVTRQRDFGDRERVNTHWVIFKDQDDAIRDLAKQSTGGNVLKAVRNVFDTFFGLPKDGKK